MSSPFCCYFCHLIVTQTLMSSILHSPRNHLDCHPGRPAQATRPGSQVPQWCFFFEVGVLGSRVSPLSRLARDDSRGGGEAYAIAHAVQERMEQGASSRCRWLLR